MIHIIDIINHILPEIFMGIITLICGVFYKCIKHIKEQSEQIKTSNKYLIKKAIEDDYRKFMELGYCGIKERKECTEIYKHYKKLGGNGGIEKIMEEIHELPTFKKERREYGNKLESEDKK